MLVDRFATLLCTCVLAACSSTTAASLTSCSPTSFGAITLPGALIQRLTASPVQNFSVFSPQNGAGPYFDTTYTGLSFCNVTVTYSYTAPSTDFSVRLTVWLPMQDWNGRFQGTGGSGFAAGLGASGLAPALANGYTAAETDGGHSDLDQNPASWAFDEFGRVNLLRLVAFASTSLNDLAILGKAVTKAFYGVGPKYSYWNGCSTGGRQGLMLAQRYPNAFDGIAALSPAVNWPSLTVSTYWPQQVMNRLQHFPHECELAYITKRAIEACDAKDGVIDGIISLPGLCTFNANEVVGDMIQCANSSYIISAATADIANAAWNGNGFWYGLNRGTYLSGMANTTCTGTADATCIGQPLGVWPWIPLFVQKSRTFAVESMSDEAYRAVFLKSVLQYQDIIGTANPDLSSFKASGGKMISTHGLADPAIFPNGTSQYYNSVLFFDPDAADYYRLFEVPGIGHCGSPETRSYYPNDTLEALVRWVEDERAPSTLSAISQVDHTSMRPLCSYPKEQHYIGGSVSVSGSFQCVQTR